MNEKNLLPLQIDETINEDVTTTQEDQNEFNNFELREPEDEKNNFKEKEYNVNLEKPPYKPPTEDEFKDFRNTTAESHKEHRTKNDDRFEEYKTNKRNRSFKEKLWDSSKNISDNLWSFTKFIIMLCVLGPIVLVIGLPILMIIPAIAIAIVATIFGLGAMGITVVCSTIASFTVLPINVFILLLFGGILIILGCAGICIIICMSIIKKLFELIKGR